MQPEQPSNPNVENSFGDEGPRMRAPLNWRLHNLWLSIRIPLVIVMVIAGWYYIPQLEARSQQRALASVFFDVCRKTLKDTEQLPKVPEEALAEALKKHAVTDSAILAWAPQVSSKIQKGQWIARIEFAKPADYAIEEPIGPALAEAGYDTPSPGP